MQALTAPGVSPEYLALVDEQMRPVARVDARTVVVIAARVGTTRLIDNVVLGEGVAADTAVRNLWGCPPGPSSLLSAPRMSSVWPRSCRPWRPRCTPPPASAP